MQQCRDSDIGNQLMAVFGEQTVPDLPLLTFRLPENQRLRQIITSRAELFGLGQGAVESKYWASKQQLHEQQQLEEMRRLFLSSSS